MDKFNAVKTGSTYATGWGYNANGLNTSIVEKTDDGANRPLDDCLRRAWQCDAHHPRHLGCSVDRGCLRCSWTHAPSGRNDGGATVSVQYSPRGFVTGKTVGAESIAFVQNPVGLTTEVRMPDNQTLAYVYDASHKLIDVRLNGASITPAMLAASDYPDTLNRTVVAYAKALLERGISALIPPAYAQSSAQVGRRVVPVPGGAMPGQPEFDPLTDMMSMAPMSDFDKAAREHRRAVRAVMRMQTRWWLRKADVYLRDLRACTFQRPPLAEVQQQELLRAH